LKQGWKLLEDYVFGDEAISGATDNRPGLKALLASAKLKPRPFDVVLVDDTSRLSRKLRDALGIFDELVFLQIRIVFVGQGIEMDSEQAEVLLATHGIVDSLYIRELSKKAYRGVEGRALQGLHTGGRCFGCRNVPIEDATKRDQYGRPTINGVRLVVEPRQAEVVCRIFGLYAASFSMKRIAKKLNAERVESPRPQTGRISRSWCPSSIRKTLHNDRYRGIVFGAGRRRSASPLVASGEMSNCPLLSGGCSRRRISASCPRNFGTECSNAWIR
jgi:DNA invertase Pin-like site-specific DNA recombinase